jgi:hypothetical protein
MDPNLFHIDWERTFEALFLIIILAFFIERALALVFEMRWFLKKAPGGLKAIIAVIVSVAICFYLKFDALSTIILTEKTCVPGYIITGAIIAGGSKASIKLFHDIFDVKSSAYRELGTDGKTTSRIHAETVVSETRVASTSAPKHEGGQL